MRHLENIKIRVVIFVGWFLLLLIGGGCLIADLDLQRLSALDLQLPQLQMTLQQAKTMVATLPTLEQQQQNALANLEQALSNTTDTTFVALTAAAQMAQLRLETLTPAADIVNPHYLQTPVQISAVSDYQHLLALLQQLQQAKLWLVPSAITINASDSTLKIMLTLNHYHNFTGLLEPFTTATIAVLPSLQPASTKLPHNPFLPPTVHPWRTVIMSGILTINKKQLALLQLADGSMVAVATGDQFSDYQTIIEKMTSHYVVLTQSSPTANGVHAVTRTIYLPEAESAP